MTFFDTEKAQVFEILHHGRQAFAKPTSINTMADDDQTMKLARDLLIWYSPKFYQHISI